MPFGKIYKVNPQAKVFVCGFILVLYRSQTKLNLEGT